MCSTSIKRNTWAVGIIYARELLLAAVPLLTASLLTAAPPVRPAAGGALVLPAAAGAHQQEAPGQAHQARHRGGGCREGQGQVGFWVPLMAPPGLVQWWQHIPMALSLAAWTDACQCAARTASFGVVCTCALLAAVRWEMWKQTLTLFRTCRPPRAAPVG